MERVSKFSQLYPTLKMMIRMIILILLLLLILVKLCL